MALVIVPPAFSCPYDCLVTEYDDDGDGTVDNTTARCIEAEGSPSGSYGSCEPERLCYRMPGAGTYCMDRCEGEPCMVA